MTHDKHEHCLLSDVVHEDHLNLHVDADFQDEYLSK